MTDQHPSPRELERLSAEELPDEARKDVEAHLAHCTRCRGYLDQLTEDQKLLLETLPPHLLATQVEARAQAEPQPSRWPGRYWWTAGGLAVAGGAAALLLLLPAGPEPAPADSPPGIRLMGLESVRVYRKRGPEVTLIDPTDGLHAGDELRFEVTAPGAAAAALVAFPPSGEAPVVLAPPGVEAFSFTGRAVLPGAVQVTPDPEPVLLVLVVRPATFHLADVLEEARRARRGQDLEGAAFSMVVAPEIR